MQLTTISKAIAGFLAGVVVAQLAKYGFELDQASVDLVIYGLVSGVIVYLSPKNK